MVISKIFDKNRTFFKISRKLKNLEIIYKKLKNQKFKIKKFYVKSKFLKFFCKFYEFSLAL